MGIPGVEDEMAVVELASPAEQILNKQLVARKVWKFHDRDTGV